MTIEHARESALVLDWATAGAPLADEASGDLEVVAPFPGGVLVGVIDGLGHGDEAAEASRRAAEVLAARAGDPVDALIEQCHVELRKTRGAVMSLVSFHAEGEPGSAMTWVSVGNVDAVVFHADAEAAPARHDLLTRGGVVGYLLPPLRPVTLAVSPGDTLIMATDGLRSGFAASPIPEGSPRDVAESLFEAYAKGTDDALVLVARYGGRAPCTSR